MNKESLVHLFHMLIVGGLFLYVGTQTTGIPKMMFPMLLGVGAIIILYHAFKVYSKILQGKGYWVNLIHILLVGPLLLYIGYNGDTTARLYFELLLMLGFASIGYHGYYFLGELLSA
jgi:hypothetical protein